ncbi:MAG TPA: hypothetical protein VFN09_03505 [Rhodanobacteraceae bacterium]|nr:hypothetical protein [Rhodanobacteraceae bacterium]
MSHPIQRLSQVPSHTGRLARTLAIVLLAITPAWATAGMEAPRGARGMCTVRLDLDLIERLAAAHQEAVPSSTARVACRTARTLPAGDATSDAP